MEGGFEGGIQTRDAQLCTGPCQLAELLLACNEVKRFPCNGSMIHDDDPPPLPSHPSLPPSLPPSREEFRPSLEGGIQTGDAQLRAGLMEPPHDQRFTLLQHSSSVEMGRSVPSM